jgi:hypothetical protein
LLNCELARVPLPLLFFEGTKPRTC